MFEQIDHPNLRGHLIWLPVLQNDDWDSAEKIAANIKDPRLTFYWNEDQSLGFPLRETLNLISPIAWDVYLLYPPDTIWHLESPPMPSFWMHQLSVEQTSNWLNSAELMKQVAQLLASAS